jgi:hypothetical protein
VSIVPRETERKIKVCVFLNKHEIINIKMIADHMFHQKLIPSLQSPHFLERQVTSSTMNIMRCYRDKMPIVNDLQKRVNLLKYLQMEKSKRLTKYLKKQG